MNLGFNKEEAKLVYDALNYYFKSTQFPKELLECYPGADLSCMISQLQIVAEAGEDPNDHKIDWLED